jgi:uncharacterized Zn finger protein
MKTKRKCPNCQMNTSQQIAEGITHRKWYRYYECTECKRTQSYRINRPANVETEYSVSSTESNPIGINAKDWPEHG